MSEGTTRIAAVGFVAVSILIGTWMLLGEALVPTGPSSTPASSHAAQFQARPCSETKPQSSKALPESIGRVAVSEQVVPPSLQPVNRLEPEHPAGDVSNTSPIKNFDWASGMMKDCGMAESDIEKLKADTKLLRDVGAVWNDLSKSVGKSIHDRSVAVATYAKTKERLGHYDVVSPDGPFPDADARSGEIITYGYETNPRGGRDLVRVIRILPGESPSVDAAIGAERLAVENRRLVIQQMVLGR